MLSVKVESLVTFLYLNYYMVFITHPISLTYLQYPGVYLKGKFIERIAFICLIYSMLRSIFHDGPVKCENHIPSFSVDENAKPR